MQFKLQSKHEYAGNDKVQLMFDTNVDATSPMPAPAPGPYVGVSNINLMVSPTEASTYEVGQVYTLALT